MRRASGGEWRSHEERGEKGRTVEGDAGEREAEDHPRGGEDHDPPPADDVDVLERDEGEDEVGSGDDKADSGWLVESNLLEQCG